MSYKSILASETDTLFGDPSDSESLYCLNADWELSDGALPPLAQSLSTTISPRVERTIKSAPVLHINPSTAFSETELNNFDARMDLDLRELFNGIDHRLEKDQQS